ncbi:Hypothetical predicted protein [Octopus vulgaris]|uniref:DNA replication complex GINS protein SLD5 n=2 Tax=Octopus vulgaris TaxID=6645 RepID=A0AA36BRM2_OCTVU|nr:Hypothetical predicted protein [Octopus vulgaris]
MTDLGLSLDLSRDEEDVEPMTANEVLSKLEEAWLNEKFSPVLLEAKTEIVECLLEQIGVMEENIRKAKKGDFKVNVHRMELDRVRFVLNSYLRIRLEKIQSHAAHYINKDSSEDEEHSLFSPAELAFAKEYLSSVEDHLTGLAVQHMPAMLHTLRSNLSGIAPSLDSYVFFKVNKDVDGVLVEEETLETGDEIVDLKKGDQHIMRYLPVQSLVASADISLI